MVRGSHLPNMMILFWDRISEDRLCLFYEATLFNLNKKQTRRCLDITHCYYIWCNLINKIEKGSVYADLIPTR